MVDRVQAGKRAQLTSCVPPVVFRSTWHGMLREIIARLRVKVLQESIMEVQPDAKKHRLSHTGRKFKAYQAVKELSKINRFRDANDFCD